MSQQQRPIVGIAAHVCHNGRVLVIERISDGGPHTFTVLGGHLEYGESPEQCAIREAQEEAGIAPHSPQIFAITNDILPSGKHYVTLHVALKADTEAFTNLEPHKHINLQWCKWEEIPTPRFPCLVDLYTRNVKPPYLEQTATLHAFPQPLKESRAS